MAFRPQLLKDTLLERELFRRRAMLGFLLICSTFGVLAGRFFYLQVVMHDEFVALAEANRIKDRALAPNRGLIFDRNGVLLAGNRPAYRLEIVPEQTRDRAATIASLREIIPISDEEIDRFNKLRQARRSFQGIPLKLRLSDHEVARFAVNRHRFPGADVVAYQSRQYPAAEVLAHVIGYVGRLDVEDLQSVDSDRYAATTHIGKTGIERFYEGLLHGEVGFEKVETNAQGRSLGVIERGTPAAGNDLQLTIDLTLQRAAIDALGDYTGSAVVVDPRSGELLAMVSEPGYDPNLFVNGISSNNYQALLSDPRRPLFNRSLQGGYEPGSTLKPYIGLAGLESGVIDLSYTDFSGGYYQLPNQPRKYRDWKRGGHGWVDITQALGQSVNVFFYKLAVELGIDRIHHHLDQFGFGRPTGIDLHGEASGVLASREWKRAIHGQPWYPGETVITGIGQGYTVTTPLQLAQAAALMASGGSSPRIHLLKAVFEPETGLTANPEYPLIEVPVGNPEHWRRIQLGMREVVHGKKGTARAIVSDKPPYEIAGKSGTAQVYGLKEGEEYNEDEVAAHLRDHALFIAFAPVDAPEVAVAVVAEHGGGGSSVAAPIARKILDAYFAGQVEEVAVAEVRP